MEGGSKNKGAWRRNNGGDGGEKEWGFDAGENVKKMEVTAAVAPELEEAAEEPRSCRAGLDLRASGTSSSLMQGPRNSGLQRQRRSRRQSRASEKEPAASDQASRKKEPAARRSARERQHWNIVGLWVDG